MASLRETSSPHGRHYMLFARHAPDNSATNSQDYLSLENNFALLSLRDLLAAREHFHWHLMHKQNVVATAVGRYRIRKSDPRPGSTKPNGNAARSAERRPVRTLTNSEVRSIPGPRSLFSLNAGSIPTISLTPTMRCHPPCTCRTGKRCRCA